MPLEATDGCVGLSGRVDVRRDDPRRACPAAEPCSQRSSSSGLPTVADSPTRCSGRPASRRQPFQHGQQMPAPVVAGERVHLVHDDGPQRREQPPWSTLVLTSIDSSDSGVVAGCPAGRRSSRCRAPG